MTRDADSDQSGSWRSRWGRGAGREEEGPSEEDLVRSGLEETMIGAYHPIRETWKQHRGEVDLRTAAMIVAIDKVAQSYAQLGIFP